jgi:transcriptional regulator with GAF, ATPase, and Fis domain
MGRPLESGSARIDPRFRDLTSVHRKGIEAVICIPISTPEIEGAVYLDRVATAGGFTASAFEVAQWFAHQYAEVADRLVPQPPRSLHDETRRFQQRRVRTALVHSNWNVASAARELGVTRNFVYSLSPEARRRRR